MSLHWQLNLLVRLKSLIVHGLSYPETIHWAHL